MSPFNKTPVDIHISNTEILNQERIKLLGVNHDGGLNFDFQVNTLLKKASKKYQPLARMCNYMNKKKRRILINAFITCFLTAFLFECLIGGLRINRINKIQEKA